MAGGPTVNLMIAFFIFAGLFATVGNPGDENVHARRSTPSRPASSRPPRRAARCTPSDPVSPAAEAGLKPGDRFVSFNGTAIQSWDQMQTLIRGNNDGAGDDRGRPRRRRR